MIIHTFFLLGEAPPPASPEAVKKGCICSEILNRDGNEGDRGWYIDSECPVHAPMITGIGRCAT